MSRDAFKSISVALGNRNMATKSLVIDVKICTILSHDTEPLGYFYSNCYTYI